MPRAATSVSGGGIQTKTGSFTRDISTASGTQAVTGTGFQATVLIFFFAVSGSVDGGWGFSDAAGNNGLSRITSDTFDWNSGVAIYLNTSVGATYSGVVSSFDSNGFTITWTKGGHIS